MELPFTHAPGRRERHLRRIHANPLFTWPPRLVPPEELLAAQQADHEEMEDFLVSFKALMQRAVDLPADAGSDLVLELKEELERHYEQSWGLPGSHAGERAGMRTLIDLIMKTLERVAGADPLARQELADEARAREHHFKLLERPLVVDLLHPESAVARDDLLPALLSASLVEVDAVLDLFDIDQIELLADRSVVLLEHLKSEGVDLAEPRLRASRIFSRLDREDPFR